MLGQEAVGAHQPAPLDAGQLGETVPQALQHHHPLPGALQQACRHGALVLVHHQGGQVGLRHEPRWGGGEEGGEEV